jgi:stearoyl-CoA desaturase (delta-9 desaturase)
MKTARRRLHRDVTASAPDFAPQRGSSFDPQTSMQSRSTSLLPAPNALRHARTAILRWFDAGQEPKCREGHGWPRAAAGQEPKCDGQEPECEGQEPKCAGQEPKCREGHGWPGAARGGHGWPKAAREGHSENADDSVDWLRVAPFIGMHLACIGVLWVGFSWFAFWIAVTLYALRMFAITAFYHRYFSHKAFKTSRTLQFAFALLGSTCAQRGPLWWAAHHRDHHRNADTEHDLHSPLRRGFLWSHMGWFLTPRAFPTRWEAIPDLQRYPELRWLDRYDLVLPIALASGLFFVGHWAGSTHPELGTSGAQLLVWGFFVSTVALFHATVTINSLAHRFGTRRFATSDNSRNNFLLALLTFGEGWHNNHHHFPGSARQGFRWWEIDLTWYALRALAVYGLVWDLKPVPSIVRRPAADQHEGMRNDGLVSAPAGGMEVQP